MVTALLVAALFAAVYLTLIALHVTAIRHHAGQGRIERPRLAVWLAAHLRPGPQDRVPADAGLARAEREAVRRLLAGALDKDAYRAELACVAARDEAAHPLELPRSRH
jgi:hypothetical protein